MCLAVSPAVEDEALDELGLQRTQQDASASADAKSNANSTSGQEQEATITYPSRLVYFVNEEEESAYHDLDTRAHNQAAEGQVS